ncbi:MAG: Eco57I restriction-modification methylase domain-containing protein, partial [Anaerolineales bacterium]|nr:Eco57I restriction-modification methylase domain-containing protein [Anaerolineales bacterium]
GVYYTPTFIVDTIVENTIGKLVSGKLGIGMTPKEVTKLRIVDPACGSGTFLLGAYQYLLDWHLNWYLNNDFEKWSKGKNAVLVQSNPARFKSAGGARGRDGWKLSVEKKKEILLNNIYGVDIDPQAVEVTKLSLLLKVIEDPGQLSYLDERILPDLGKNIQCGNSLIGLDYWDGKMREMISEEERARVNAFDWKAAFPEVFAQGAHSTDSGQGFDVVVGNPPYIRIHNLIDYYPDEVRFIQSHYLTASFGKVDIFVAFVEKGMQILKKTGMLGFILPNKFMQSDYGVGLRTLISEKQALTQLIDFGNAQVFNGATTYTCLLFLSNSPQKEFQSKFNKTFESPERFLQEAVFETRKSLSFSSAPWQMASSIETTLLEKLETAPARLSDMVELAITGVKTGANSIFIFEIIQLDKDIAKLRREDTDDIVEIETKYLVRYLKAESLKRYRVGSGSRVLLYPYESVNDQTRLVSEDQIKNYPKTWQYLNKFKHDLESRQKGKLKGASWYGLSFSSSLQMFSVQKIITPTLSPRNSFSLDVDSFFFPQGAGGGCGLVPKENISAYYLLGLLNSRLLTFFFQRISSPFQGGWYAYEPRYLTRIPIHPINLSNPAEKAQHDKMVSLVERMLALQKSLQSAHNPQEADRLTREVESTDKAIDNLVYELYGLTEEEIGIVEGK